MGRKRPGSSANSDEAVARGEKASGWAMPVHQVHGGARQQNQHDGADAADQSPPADANREMLQRRSQGDGKRTAAARPFATQAVIAPCCSSEVMPSGAKLSGTIR